MKYLTLLVFVGVSACTSAPIERLVVPSFGPVCYQLVCTE
jgi:hypothetical protein